MQQKQRVTTLRLLLCVLVCMSALGDSIGSGSASAQPPAHAPTALNTARSGALGHLQAICYGAHVLRKRVRCLRMWRQWEGVATIAVTTVAPTSAFARARERER